MEKVKFNWKRLLALLGVSATLLTATGCGKKAECTVGKYHLHKYVNQTGYVRYIDEEWMNYQGYDRQEE